jgi:hypothetical protein
VAGEPVLRAWVEAQESTSEAVSEVEYVSLPMSALSRGERRLEAETYLSGGYGLRARIESSSAFTPLGDLANVWQPGRLKGALVSARNGLPFLTATQVFDIRPVARKWVAPSKTPDLPRRFVERGWILVTCSGSVGDVIATYGPHLKTVISHDLLRVQVLNPSHRGYLYAFLRSRLGRTILRSSKYGSVVKHLEPQHLLDVPIPSVQDSVLRELNEGVDHVYDLRDRAFCLTCEAEGIYSDQFAVVDADIDSEGYIVPARTMFSRRRRLDAAHYNPTADQVELKLRSAGSGRIQPLSDIVRSVVLPNRFKRVRAPVGTPYLDSEDVFKVNPEITKTISAASSRGLGKYLVERGWLLLARSGQTYGLNGSVMLANGWHEDKIVSEHIIRIVPGDIRPGYLAMALGHPVYGRPLILRLAFGSSVPEIAPEDLQSHPVPRLGAAEDEIADRMENASALRMEADRLEDATVACLEEHLEGRLGTDDA